MPSSRFLIASNTLTGTATSVTFSSIPATYDDLIVLLTARMENAGALFLNLDVQFNSDTSTNYSITRLAGFSTGTSSVRQSNQTYMRQVAGANSNLSTSNTFSSYELYIPGYRVSQNKPVSIYSVQENNSSTSQEAWINTTAGLWRNTAAITSMTFSNTTESPAKNFLSGSTFWLYGLKSS